MDVVLVPGLWLNAHTWDALVPHLEAAGHRTHPLTLPGMASKDTDRTGVTLVGHSAGCGIAHAAVDARPGRVARQVHVGGFPSADGEALLSGLPPEGGEVPMPDWAELGEEANVRDFDADQLARIREVELVELGGGHWPQLTQPKSLAQAIIEAGR